MLALTISFNSPKNKKLMVLTINYLKKFKIWLHSEAYSFLGQQRTDNKGKSLWDADGVLIHKLIELPCKIQKLLTTIKGTLDLQRTRCIMNVNFTELNNLIVQILTC